MIEILDAPANVVALKATGTLSESDYDAAIAEIESRLSNYRKIGMLADMTGFTDVTPGAMARDVRYSLSKLGELNRFPRCAVVSDKLWVKAMAAMWSPLLPGVEIRAFEPTEAAAAMTWVAGAPTG